jgi:hypothetical protein
MEHAGFEWRRCRSCKNGYIALFTSVAMCEQCFGMGIDLSDERLEVKLETLPLMVRSRKVLHRLSVDTVVQLLIFVSCGRLSECGSIESSGVVGDITRLLLQSGLRAREGGVLENVAAC